MDSSFPVTPLVGVGVIVRRGGRILLGKRLGSHGEGEYSFPGGHMEMWESPEQCAVREVKEETLLQVSPVRRAGYSEDRFPDIARHYVTLYVIADAPEDQEPFLKEPHKCVSWDWYSWDALPSPLFAGIEDLARSGLNPFVGERDLYSERYHEAVDA